MTRNIDTIFFDVGATLRYVVALVELYLEPGVFSERCTEKLPLRVDCIHRLEFGEVSGLSRPLLGYAQLLHYQ